MSARAMSRFQFWDQAALNVIQNAGRDSVTGTCVELGAFAANCADALLAARDARYELLALSKPAPSKAGDPDGEGPELESS